MCRALAVAAAGYDAGVHRPESPRSVNTRTLLSAIRVIHQESRETYGSPSIWDALIKQGHCVGEHRVARLMRVEGIRAKTVKKWRATTQSNHRLPVAANTPQSPVHGGASEPGVGRGHHLRVDHGRLALPGRGPRSVLTPRDRLGDGPPADRGAGRAGPHDGGGTRGPRAGLLHHSDRGCQYAATSYQHLLGEHGITTSMSRKATAGTMPVLKVSSGRSSASSCTISTTRPEKTRHKTSSSTFEVFYNRKRRHSTLGYDSPAEFEARMAIA